ncbi:hypothetical protein ACFCW7_20580 [Paenibacillus glucanolyticus]
MLTCSIGRREMYRLAGDLLWNEWGYRRTTDTRIHSVLRLED